MTRQAQAEELMGAGVSRKEIAIRLGVSMPSVNMMAQRAGRAVPRKKDPFNCRRDSEETSADVEAQFRRVSAQIQFGYRCRCGMLDEHVCLPEVATQILESRAQDERWNG